MHQSAQPVTHQEEPEESSGAIIPGDAGAMSGRDLSFLVEASRVLNRTLDVEETLATVARLSVPHLGSWCVVDLCQGDRVRRLAIVHPDPAKQSVADELLASWPPHRDDPLALRTGQSEVVFPVTDEMLSTAARSPENLAMLRTLGIGSVMSVPLLARGEVLGAITYVSPDRDHPFTRDDLVLAEDLAARCAVAIDNARLLQSAEQARAEADAAREQAEQANLIKVRFLSTMSHELRTPLNAIAGYAELLETGVRGPLTDAQLEDVHRIQVNQRHLLGLVEAVLNFAKIEAGRIEFGLADVPLADVLAEVGVIIAPLAEEKGITCLGCASPEEEPGAMVYADPDKLRQILVNLLDNAIKFSGDAATVEVTHRFSGANVQIRVTDYGTGIAPEHRERIFEPFVQVEDGLARGHEGTGLGLAISRELAVGMGGTITVESEVGRGSTFAVTLSRGRGESPGDGSRGSPRAAVPPLTTDAPTE